MSNQRLCIECAAYFSSNPGFARTIQALWEKWRSYGRMAGTVELPSPSEEEIQALEGYFGAPVLKKGKLRFQARYFEDALENTRFRGAGIKDVLEAYFGRPLISKKEEEAELNALKESFFEKAMGELKILPEELKTSAEAEIASEKFKTSTEEAEISSEEFMTSVKKRMNVTGVPDVNTDRDTETQSAAICWLTALTAQKLWQLRQSEGSEEAALRMVHQTGRALSILENTDESRGIRLAVLAMECTGNPHGFDRGTLPGNLLLGALPALNAEEDAKVEFSPRLAAEDALERYIRCGIRPDDLSSFTILYRILLFDGQGPVQAFQAMADRREPVLVSLLNLRNIQRAVPLNGSVYVIENQMVFSQLCEDCPEASLICTSGQVRTASLMVLDFLCREDVEILYSGDLDPEGICIADRLICRSKGKIRPWHMTARDYEACASAVELTDERLRELDHVQSPCLMEAAEAVRNGRKAGYQEKLLKVMAEEMR
ncbi:MAG: DUF2399 domain-containing protein [Blautia sp.]|nr:DUF2399 domain-containing protein [Blautia sp.]